MAKSSDVILLDEPSSALDPIAEYKMFETMAGLCKNKDVLSVIVSHRLSSARCARKYLFLIRANWQSRAPIKSCLKTAVYTPKCLKSRREII